jgi:2-phosphosulfolactate phosphatase
VVPSGEQWADSALRPAIEDLIGAGAIISHFSTRTLSPEAATALGAYRSVAGNLSAVLRECASGRELCEKGYQEDVLLAAELDVSQTVPIYREPAYVITATPGIARVDAQG